jgi:hypothetical protein
MTCADKTLQRDADWQDHRNKHHATDWPFTTDDARVKEIQKSTTDSMTVATS